MESFALVIFGITGNLAQIKLIPALYDMEEKGLLPKGMDIVGIARRDMSNEDFKNYIHETLHLENIHHKHEIKEQVFKALCKRLKYISGQIQDQDLYKKLGKYLKHDNRIFYLATYPELYHQVFGNLQKNNLNKQSKGWVRLMIEKPIGHDLPSAQALNQLLLEYFTEDQIFRLDHYLGKETLQNILKTSLDNDPQVKKARTKANRADRVTICGSKETGHFQDERIAR